MEVLEPQEERILTLALQPDTPDTGPQPGPSDLGWAHHLHIREQQEDQPNSATQEPAMGLLYV
jgi:hypothetical protein